MSESIEKGKLIAGKYWLLERISGGGMGSVWRAHHAQLDAPVAIKFMHSSMLGDRDARVRFEREAKAAARIRSPHVVHVHDHGIDESGAPYIVMECLEGEDLGTRLKRVRTLEPEQAVRLCDQVCKGLTRAHALGIVHRDLKPGNIFICEADDDLVKIVDFGIAKETGQNRVVSAEATATGQLLGSPHYMSPEQARGQELDHRSDLWSLAAILFRAVTGKRPFEGKDFGDLAVRICTDPIPAASSLDARLSPAVDRFFWRAFDRNPDGRFQTTEDFSAAFEAAIVQPPEPRRTDLPLELPPVLPTKAVQAETPRLVTVRQDKKGGGFLFTVLVLLLVFGAIVMFWDEVRTIVEGPPTSSATVSPTPASEAKAQRARELWETLYTQVRMNEIPQAVESLAQLVELEPEAPRDKHNTILELAVRAFDRRDRTSERMAALMTTGMGEHGLDLLFDLMVTRKGTKASEKAASLLADREVRARGSKDMNHAHAIHTATCAQKKSRIVLAKDEGGARTLREIRALTSCESRSCCLKDDETVKAVTSAIATRP